MPRRITGWRLSAAEVVRLATASTKLTNFRHMLPIDENYLRRSRQSVARDSPNVVPTNQRIKYWNIVPGDKVRIRGDDTFTVHTVAAINRWTNRVHLNADDGPTDENGQKLGPNEHYSKLQLYVGQYKIAPPPGETTPVMSRVFALRTGTSPPKWDPKQKSWVWRRYAVATEPFAPALKGKRVRIPWPPISVLPPVPPQPSLDTPRSEVERVTWRPPPFPTDKGATIPQPPSERSFLSTIVNGKAYDVQHPFEIYLAKELTNPHGFAKRHDRWMAFQSYKKTLLGEFIKRELADLNGRTQADARADAAFKCKQHLEQDRKNKVSTRIAHSNIKLDRKAQRKARKQHKIRERLANMVLTPAPNQFIPPQLTA